MSPSFGKFVLLISGEKVGYVMSMLELVVGGEEMLGVGLKVALI